MKFVLGALAAAVIAGVAFVQPAEARCFWNGFATVCYHHGPFMYRHGFHHPFYGGGYERPYWWGGY